MKTDEEKLSQGIKSGDMSRVYYLYGEERFLTKTYTDRILDKTVGKDRNDINLVKLGEVFPVDALIDSIDALPLFADSKAVLINDLDLDKFEDNDIEAIIAALGDVPDECTVVISITGANDQLKKAKNKKLINALTKQKDAAVCEFSYMAVPKVADLIVKKAAKRGCIISVADARRIAEMTLCDLSLCSAETDKLCSYAGSGKITPDMIDKLIVKQLDTNIFALSAELAKGNCKQALHILDDLFSQRKEPEIILASLASNYIDFYRAKAALNKGISADKTATDFAYAKNRTFVVSKAMKLVKTLDMAHIRESLNILSETDLALKTTGTDRRATLEKAIIKLSSQKSRREYY